jgi:hypothetical protein
MLTKNSYDFKKGPLALEGIKEKNSAKSQNDKNRKK